MANLIVSTTNNNEPMNNAVEQVAKHWMIGTGRNHRANDECGRSQYQGL